MQSMGQHTLLLLRTWALDTVSRALQVFVVKGGGQLGSDVPRNAQAWSLLSSQRSRLMGRKTVKGGWDAPSPLLGAGSHSPPQGPGAT